MSYRQTDKLSIEEAQLNEREQRVLKALRERKEPLHLSAIKLACFPGLRCKAGTYGRENGGGTVIGYRASLNSVRRLVAAGFIKRVDKGTYAAVEVSK
jgi:hypothetical protein